MRLSVSGRSERLGGAAAVLGTLYVAAHLPFLARSLEDIDSINFALGLRDFEPARHQPHPPGYPVYIAIGRVVLTIAEALTGMSGVAAEALALSLISAAAGGFAVAGAVRLFAQCAPGSPTTALATAALMAACPLFWLTGLRPMSDMPGLALALWAQAWMLEGRIDSRRLVLGAAAAGLAVGIRAQTALLTLPLFTLAVVQRRTAGAAWLLTRPGAALAAGVLVWAVPLVRESGGPGAYLSALGNQAGEDFAWVGMLWLEPTVRRLAFALYETFVLPWGTVVLAAIIGAVAAVGLAMLLVRDRTAAGLVAAGFAPYLVFHLLFQETFTVRYALPVVPVVSWAAMRAAAAAGRAGPLAGAALIAAALLVAVPGALAYGREAHPAFRAIADIHRQAGAARPAGVFSHYSLWRSLQADPGALPLVEPRRQYEWLGPVQYWRDGGSAPIWFLADPYRTDLALIDPHARVGVARYRWAVAERPAVSGSRPLGADWYRLDPPGWFAGEGWSLTPETGGLARQDATGPDHRPIVAWVRRHAGPLHLVVGGRHLGDAGDPAAEMELALDGHAVDRWVVTVEERNFLRFVDVPDGLAPGREPYARLTIASRAAADEGPRAAVAVRQFDIQPADTLVFAFGEGWHEEEFEPRTGLRWRWTSDRSVVRVKGGDAGVRLLLHGESPLRYLDAPPAVTVRAGDRVVARFRPDDDFAWTIDVSADDVVRSGGAITIETDAVYLPGEAERTGDERRLGLRILAWQVERLD